MASIKYYQIRKGYLFLPIWIFAFLSISFALLVALPVRAETYPVTSFEDAVDSTIGDGNCQTALTGNPCTLRAAIQESNASSQTADIIELPIGFYTLTITGTQEDESATGELDITSSIVISGSGAKSTIIQGGTAWDDRLFHFLGTSVGIINRVTISGGNIVDASGAGILLEEDIFDDGIAAGELALSECRITNNRSTQFGGGLSSAGFLRVARCTIDNNLTSGDDTARGGGIYINTNGTLVIHNSTVSSNTAQSIGGGIDFGNDSERSTLNNVTLANNRLLSPDEPGEEPDGAGISVGNTPVTITNSLLAGNLSGSGTGNDCDGNFAAVKFSLIQAKGPDCTFEVETGNTVGLAPGIGPLSDNGGETPTHALLEDSPALDAANPDPKEPESDVESCYPTDQRGMLRSDRCDMGAFERVILIKMFLLYIPSVLQEE